MLYVQLVSLPHCFISRINNFYSDKTFEEGFDDTVPLAPQPPGTSRKVMAFSTARSGQVAVKSMYSFSYSTVTITYTEVASTKAKAQKGKARMGKARKAKTQKSKCNDAATSDELEAVESGAGSESESEIDFDLEHTSETDRVQFSGREDTDVPFADFLEQTVNIIKLSLINISLLYPAGWF